MSLVQTWDWRAWSLAVLVVAVAGWFAWRWLSAVAFRHLLLGTVADRHGWQVDLSGGDGGRDAFREQERRRRRKAWGLLRQGMSGIREGYRTGVFGSRHSGAWHNEVTVTGLWRGRRFVASQVRRYEVTTSGERTRRKVRRRASLSLSGSFPVLDLRVSRFGRVRGDAPPAVVELARARRRRFRGVRGDGGGLHVELGPRLRRGRLLAALNYLSDVADRL